MKNIKKLCHLVIRDEVPFSLILLKSLIPTCISSNHSIPIQSLSIINCDLCDEQMILLSHGLANNSTIHTLNLSNNYISNVGVSDLVDGLFINTDLKNLILMNNRISDLGCVYLSELLLTNSVICQLDISYNCITEKGIEILSKTIANNSTLTHLDIGNNQIGDTGCKLFAECMKINKSIEILDVSYNHIHSDGICSLCEEGINYNRSIREFSVRGNEFDSKGAKQLVSSLKDHQSLKDIDIGHIDTLNFEGFQILSQTLSVKYLIDDMVVISKK
jgi:Ran GTPase-activating protein (RanGAP) involved in mRNA processing and transport